MRTYKKRTKSTKSKTYKEYLEMRKELAGKGYELKEVLSERQFKEAYDMLKEANCTSIPELIWGIKKIGFNCG